MIYADNFVPDLYACELQMERVFLFDPTLMPNMPKPLEGDFQDAKTLYYHPSDLHIEIKRNDVGLAEGMTVFWNAFGGKPKEVNKFQIIYTNQYTYIIYNFEDNLWICFLMKNYTKEQSYYSIDDKTSSYLAQDTFKIEKPIVTEHISQRFAEHFISFFELFYGKVASYFNGVDKLNDDFAPIFDKYIASYKKLNSLNAPRITMTKYYDRYLNYAPIDKKVFMAIHYLLDVIKNIDPQIKQQIVFYNGYFIYSTFETKIVQAFYDYLYIGGDTLAIDANKVFTKFTTFTGQNPDPNISYGKRLNIKGNKGFLTGYGENNEPQQHGNTEGVTEGQDKKENSSEFIPTVHLERLGHNNKYKLITYYENGLALLLFYDINQDIKANKLSEIQYAVNKNISKLSSNLDKQIKRIYVQEDISRLIYENHCNFALRVSKMLLKSIESNPYRMISYMKEKFDKDQSCRSIITKCYGTWIYARFFNQRRVFLLINPDRTLAKAEEEKEKLIEYNFSNILF